MTTVSATPSSAPSPAPRSSERVLVVVPAFNEAGRVGGVVRDIREHVAGADVLVIDDGSRDGTADEARGSGALVLPLALNLGYGAALQAGYKYAVRQGYDLVAQIDADGQHRAAYLEPMLEEVRAGRSDVVVGSRFLDGDGHYRASRARRAGMALFGRMAAAVMKQPVTDPTSGFQAMRAGVAQFFCSEVYPSDYPDADILILLHRSGFRVGEVPVQMREPEGRSMHHGHRSLYYVYKMTLSILVTILRRGEHSDAD